MAEYRQRKLTSQGSSDSLLGISITSFSPSGSPVKPDVPRSSNSPLPDAVRVNSVPITAAVLSNGTGYSPETPVVLQRSSVIQRIGCVVSAPKTAVLPVRPASTSTSLDAGRQEITREENQGNSLKNSAKNSVKNSVKNGQDIPRKLESVVKDVTVVAPVFRPPSIIENADLAGKQRLMVSVNAPLYPPATHIAPNPAPFVPTHFRPAPMLASRNKAEDLKTREAVAM